MSGRINGYCISLFKQIEQKPTNAILSKARNKEVGASYLLQKNFTNVSEGGGGGGEYAIFKRRAKVSFGKNLRTGSF